jgi:hypothetical protein
MMQFHKIMEPIFARLGVKLITRNFGQGGLGTIQAAMGSGSIYGDEVDLLLWDSGELSQAFRRSTSEKTGHLTVSSISNLSIGMTEGQKEHKDIFMRQGLIAGNRIPVVWGAPWGNTFELLQMLHENADVDIGNWGMASDGVIVVESVEQAKSVPWASRYMNCKEEAGDICKEEPRFCAHCWIDREDGIKPETDQLKSPKGQVKWHPGWRSHQLMGRNIAFGVLEALQQAINTWNEGVVGACLLSDSGVFDA